MLAVTIIRCTLDYHLPNKDIHRTLGELSRMPLIQAISLIRFGTKAQTDKSCV